MRQEPSSSARKARSAARAAAVSSSEIGWSARSARASALRAVIAIAPWPGRRKEPIEAEHGAGAIGEAEPLQPGEREQGRADHPALGLAQPRLDIPAQEHRLKVRPQAQRLGLTPD